MGRERLKDQIEWNPPPSRYASFFSALLVLLAVVAVYLSVGDGPVLDHALRVFSATNSAPPAAAGQLTLTASHNRTFYWNQEGPYVIDEFAPRLAVWLKTVKEPHVLITADDMGRFGDAASLLEAVRRQGVEHVSLEARGAATGLSREQKPTTR